MSFLQLKPLKMLMTNLDRGCAFTSGSHSRPRNIDFLYCNVPPKNSHLYQLLILFLKDMINPKKKSSQTYPLLRSM